MKPYLPFSLMIGIGLGIVLWHFQSKDSCLFRFKERCYTCDEQEIFFVSTPENCSVCYDRKTVYTDWNGKSIWACLPPEQSESDEIEFPDFVSDTSCSKEKPLKDILGHCYSCDTALPVQIKGLKNLCIGKRYLTHYRNSEKSSFCPQINQIQDPYVCIACQGQWQNEKCVSMSLKPMSFCKNNSDCLDGEWCHPFYYPTYSKSGICRPIPQQKWICSKIDGYTYESAENFCMRQNARLSTFSELENSREIILSSCPDTKIWTIFDEGSIYLDSLKTPFPITKEKESFDLGGDNTYALCVQN